MAIFVTGCAGFIGSSFVLSQLKKKKQIIGIDNFDPYYSLKNKKRNLKELETFKNFKFYKGSITDKKLLHKIFKKEKIEKIVNLAAKPGVRASIEMPQEYIDVNLKGVVNLLEISKKNKIKQFIQASTSSVYGLSLEMPYKEDDSCNTPLAPYPASKKAAEMICHVYAHNFKIPITILRFFTVYGPRGRPDMAVYKFTKLINENKKIEIYGNGKTMRSYTYIDDIVSGIELSLKKKFNFEIINLGNNKTVKLNKMVSLIEKGLKTKAKIKWGKPQMGDMENTYANINKAKKLLGWKPKTSLDKGIENFTKWYAKVN